MQGRSRPRLLSTHSSSPLATYVMKTFLRLFLVDDSGPTAVEYAVMLGLIVAACLASVNLLANNTAQSFDDSAAQLAGVLGS